MVMIRYHDDVRVPIGPLDRTIRRLYPQRVNNRELGFLMDAADRGYLQLMAMGTLVIALLHQSCRCVNCGRSCDIANRA